MIMVTDFAESNGRKTSGFSSITTAFYPCVSFTCYSGFGIERDQSMAELRLLYAIGKMK